MRETGCTKRIPGNLGATKWYVMGYVLGETSGQRDK
jgi:hypothetical protein